MCINYLQKYQSWKAIDKHVLILCKRGTRPITAFSGMQVWRTLAIEDHGEVNKRPIDPLQIFLKHSYTLGGWDLKIE